ncbi:hypothetical protein, partial [uncultured Serratia sp.]|uniref:hypothetical protein n=1 Tax=uncultured Serratia sp. TaxID=239175 RepID=UPI0025976C03
IDVADRFQFARRGFLTRWFHADAWALCTVTFASAPRSHFARKTSDRSTAIPQYGFSIKMITRVPVYAESE